MIIIIFNFFLASAGVWTLVRNGKKSNQVVRQQIILYQLFVIQTYHHHFPTYHSSSSYSFDFLFFLTRLNINNHTNSFSREEFFFLHNSIVASTLLMQREDSRSYLYRGTIKWGEQNIANNFQLGKTLFSC